MGAQWCGEGTDIERALEHSNQAARYLVSGKDDCVRKACKVRGMPLLPALPTHPHTRCKLSGCMACLRTTI